MPSVSIDHADGVAIVTVDRPLANALDRDLLAELVETSVSLREGDARAVVLTGREGFFSAGLDLKEVPAMGPDVQGEMIMGVNRLVSHWYSFPRPVVCAVNGHAIAGGLVDELAAPAEIERVVQERSDPLLESWLSSRAEEAASSALRRSPGA